MVITMTMPSKSAWLSPDTLSHFGSIITANILILIITTERRRRTPIFDQVDVGVLCKALTTRQIIARGDHYEVVYGHLTHRHQCCQHTDFEGENV